MTTQLDFSKPHLLRTEEEYAAAVAEVDALLDAEVREGSDDHERLEFLSVLMEEYDAERSNEVDWATSPRAVVEFMVEQRGLTRAGLTAAMGGKSRVSEFFSGKRTLSRAQIVALRELLGVPADLLL